MFFDPDTGDVLICDNDNVSANGIDNSSVYGTPRFMAPEIVMGQAKPSRNTDLYSLAVLLFYMFMMGHPLEAKLEAEIKCMAIHPMNTLYGKTRISSMIRMTRAIAPSRDIRTMSSSIGNCIRRSSAIFL